MSVFYEVGDDGEPSVTHVEKCGKIDKQNLYRSGMSLLSAFCELNTVRKPSIVSYTRKEWQFDTCAYYRDDEIHICVPKCANIGLAGRQWSFPGYAVDRTPYGVIQHELGHHIDVIKGTDKEAYWSDYSEKMRQETGEKKITNYCPDDAEWFAEMFRLFITNPDLLKKMRPLAYARLITDGFRPVFNDGWYSRLRTAPLRIISAATNRILKQ